MMPLVLIDPDDDVLPVRARYEAGRQGWQIGVNPLRGEPRWYALADAVAAKLLTGRIPTILRALVPVPTGTQDGLRPVRLRGETFVDPFRDLFRTVVEERKRTMSRSDLGAVQRDRLAGFLKVFANATSYGIFAEMNRRELPAGRRETVEVFGIDDPFPADVGTPETPGDFCFPPIPTWIAAGARLMLAMLESSVTDLGGTYASCDTDSMAVVATETGGLVACPGGPLRMLDGSEGIDDADGKRVAMATGSAMISEGRRWPTPGG
ncbi:MAG: hypothetical protein ACRDHK_09910 [Actinomycetota bacterium]